MLCARFEDVCVDEDGAIRLAACVMLLLSNLLPRGAPAPRDRAAWGWATDEMLKISERSEFMIGCCSDVVVVVVVVGAREEEGTRLFTTAKL